MINDFCSRPSWMDLSDTCLDMSTGCQYLHQQHVAKKWFFGQKILAKGKKMVFDQKVHSLSYRFDSGNQGSLLAQSVIGRSPALPLCVEIGFYGDISQKNKVQRQKSVWSHLYFLLVVLTDPIANSKSRKCRELDNTTKI